MQDPAFIRARSSGPIGHAATLLLLPTNSAMGFGPVWAVLCGACAALTSSWAQNGATGLADLTGVARTVAWSVRQAALALVFTVFLAEVLWSSWRALLVDTDWRDVFTRWPLPPASGRGFSLLYVTPWSPLGRLLLRWNQTRLWLRQEIPAQVRGALYALPVLPPLILLVSGLVGERTAILSLAALSLPVLEWRLAGHGRSCCSLRAALEIGLSWLGGHIALHPLTWSSFALACCYAVAYQGAVSLEQGLLSRTSDRRGWSLALFYGGQLAAVSLVVLLGHPMLATGVALLLGPQLLLVSELTAGRSEAWFLRRAATFFMVAMALASWAA